MTKGILGKKLGMTQVFAENGESIPVTVLEAGPCVVLQVKDTENDGYNAIQRGCDDQKEHRANKPSLGHVKKADTAPKRYIREIRDVNLEEYEVGKEVKVDIFAQGEKVDVVGTSKGKGFAGSIKRHNQARGAMSHGSRYHRGPGALGAVDPMKVFKGRPLPGRMGRERVTIQNLEVVRVDPERNLLLVKGSIPGAKNSYVTIKSAIKSR